MISVKNILLVGPRKDSYQCFGFEWKECDESTLDIIDKSTCPIIEERIDSNTEPVRIDLHESLLKSFNELSVNQSSVNELSVNELSVIELSVNE